MNETLDLVRSSHAAAPKLPPIVRQEKAVAPVTFWQKDWLEWISRGTAFTVPLVFVCYGEVNVPALRRSLDLLIQRHENLRTCYRHDDAGNASQMVLDETELALAHVDLTGCGHEINDRYVQKVITDYYEIPFDITKDLPVRAHLFKVAPDHHLLLLCLSHIATDSYSGSLIVRELIACYEALRTGGSPDLRPLRVQFNDFALWSHDLSASGVLGDSIEQWRAHLAGTTPIRLPSKSLTDEGASAGRYVQGWTGAAPILDVLPDLQRVAKEARATPVNVVRAALRVVLAQWTGQSDLYTASVTHGRPKPALHKLTGLFRGFVGMRIDASGDPSFLELIRRLQHFDTEMGAHELAFQEVLGRGMATLPRLAEHCFVDHMSGFLRSGKQGRPQQDSLNLTPFMFELRDERTMPEQMNFRTHVSANSVQSSCSYAANLFDADEIRLLLRRYGEAVVFFSAHPEKKLSAFGNAFA